MKTKIAFSLCFFLLLSLTAVAQTGQPAAKEKSLYQRLGGYDAIAAVTDDFVVRLTTDAQLKRFFAGMSESAGKRTRQHIVDFLCEATGGPCAYHGKDMKTAHKGMKISESDWNVAVKLLVATLDKFKVPDREKNEVLTAVSGTKKDIVEVP
jgi:hemoglobin